MGSVTVATGPQVVVFFQEAVSVRIAGSSNNARRRGLIVILVVVVKVLLLRSLGRGEEPLRSCPTAAAQSVSQSVRPSVGAVVLLRSLVGRKRKETSLFLDGKKKKKKKNLSYFRAQRRQRTERIQGFFASCAVGTRKVQLRWSRRDRAS